jgi:hypothetical protein
MKTIKNRFSTLFTVLFLCLFAVASTFGAGKKKGTPVAHHETVITSVSADSIVITADKVPKTYTVSQFTEVTVNGQKSTVADLKPGMNVSVTLSDPTRLSRITATTK